MRCSVVGYYEWVGLTATVWINSGDPVARMAEQPSVPSARQLYDRLFLILEGFKDGSANHFLRGQFDNRITMGKRRHFLHCLDKAYDEAMVRQHLCRIALERQIVSGQPLCPRALAHVDMYGHLCVYITEVYNDVNLMFNISRPADPDLDEAYNARIVEYQREAAAGAARPFAGGPPGGPPVAQDDGADRADEIQVRPVDSDDGPPDNEVRL